MKDSPVTYKPKIGFFIISALFIILNSCENNKNDVIPDVYVNFTISLTDPEFVDLNAIGGSVGIDAKTNNLGYAAAGYDGNGIIVHSGADSYYAYDRTCPHDYAVNGLSVKINIDGIYAICPKCSTTYALPAGGTPASGIGRYPLKNYKTSFDGRYITVWNN